ncbi:hypothetical protein LCGC14_1554060 [marine sediment metagenome]|uniref:Uncharacterized protein n=1 Tax=marine sediment metagenome TaxID=412755 RepID=A0A0F9IPH0_9ZZZZ
MGAYISTSDLNAEWGEGNVILWSNLDNTDTSVDAARVTAAIAYAEGYVETRLRNLRYLVPFVFNSAGARALFTRIMAVIAGEWLASHRAVVINEDLEATDLNQLPARRKWAENQIDMVSSSQMQPDLALGSDDVLAPFVVT